MKNKLKNKFILILFIMIVPLTSCSDLINDAVNNDLYKSYPAKSWTVMAFLNGDNSLESNLKSDIEEMTKGMSDNSEIYLVVMFDGREYGDTKILDIRENTAVAVSGREEFPDIGDSSIYEADMGDAETLRKFIRFCKRNYPAENYGLIIGSHGNGARGVGDEEVLRAIGPDDSTGNLIYIAEITDKLTADESVQFFGMDACYMGTCEVAYQYRPGNGSFEAEVFVGSAVSEMATGWDYENIFSRIRKSMSYSGEYDTTNGGKEKVYSSSSLTPLELGSVVVEEMHDSAVRYGKTDQTLVCCDLSTIAVLKSKVDELAVLLKDEKNDSESIRDSQDIFYFSKTSDFQKINYPHFDLIELCDRISQSLNFSGIVKAKATEVISVASGVIKYSYGGSYYTGFTKNKNGLAIFFPYEGNWADQLWYHPEDVSGIAGCYGKISWCNDSAIKNNGVENWFELLDSWYDSGDANTYIP